MDDLRAAMVFLTNGLLIFFLTTSYSNVISGNNIVVSKQLDILNGAALTVSVALILSSLYFVLKKRIKASINLLKKEILELNQEEFAVYKLVKKKANIAKISEKTKIPQHKIKKIMKDMNEKGIIKTSKTGKIRIPF